ncbi:MAG: hypothetical protein BSOLF_1927 [Candidatus Carbobacillus altaicus]|uniref:Uncharacterized protein n=1 Tax=Candidatus Carbonibacillus altaicus TaxID=2163959 RepID=A0A2R6XYL7_9BACL|nr:MAG: hypothetical protein BSOLF_1927 [Candidatus Carbobacillus altaicus]
MTLVEVLASLFLLGLISLFFYQALGLAYLANQKMEDWQDMRKIGEALLQAGRALADEVNAERTMPALRVDSLLARRLSEEGLSDTDSPANTSGKEGICRMLQEKLSYTSLTHLPYYPIQADNTLSFIPLTDHDREALSPYLPPSLITSLERNHETITICYWIEPITADNKAALPSPLYHLAFLIGDHKRNPVLIDGLVGGMSP